MKKRVAAGIAALLLLCCAGCTGQDSSAEQTDTQQPENQFNESVSDEWSETEYDWRLSVPFYNNVEEAANMEYIHTYPIFILHDGRFYNLQPTKSTYTVSDRVNESSVLSTLQMSSDELPILNLAEGDELVTFSATDNDYAFVPLDDLGVCLPLVWRAGIVAEQMAEIYGSNPEFKVLGSGVGHDMSYVPDNLICEIQGQAFTPYTGGETRLTAAQNAERIRQADAEFCSVLDSLNIPYLAVDCSWNNGGGLVQEYTNYIIQGNYGDILTLGEYQGTKYVESDFMLSNTLYKICTDSTVTSVVERTHDGYSVIQIPENISGTYAVRNRIDSGRADCYALSIIR